MLLLLLLLGVVPIAAYRIARRRAPRHRFLVLGVAFGAVISPLSLGIYATFFIPYIGLIPGIVGLLSTTFHGEPVFWLAQQLGIIPYGVVSGVSHFYLAVVDGLIWSAIYGSIGAAADRVGVAKHLQKPSE